MALTHFDRSNFPFSPETSFFELVEEMVKLLVQRWSDVLAQISSRKRWDGSTKPGREFLGGSDRSKNRRKQQRRQQVVGGGGSGNVNRHRPRALCSDSNSVPIRSRVGATVLGEFSQRKKRDFESLRRGSHYSNSTGKKPVKLREFVRRILFRLLPLVRPDHKKANKNLITGSGLFDADHHYAQGTGCSSRQYKQPCLFIMCQVLLPEKSEEIYDCPLDSHEKFSELDVESCCSGAAASLDPCFTCRRFFKALPAETLDDVETTVEKKTSGETSCNPTYYFHGPGGSDRLLPRQCSTTLSGNLEEQLDAALKDDVGISVIGDIPDDISQSSSGNLKVRMVPSNCDDYSDATGEPGCDDDHDHDQLLGVNLEGVLMQMDWRVGPDYVNQQNTTVADDHYSHEYLEQQPPEASICVKVPDVVDNGKRSRRCTMQCAGTQVFDHGTEEELVTTDQQKYSPSVSEEEDDHGNEEELVTTDQKKYSPSVSEEAHHGTEQELVTTAIQKYSPSVVSEEAHHDDICQLLMLPEDLQNKVLARLAIGDVFRLRSSCPTFRDLPNRGSFKQARGTTESRDVQTLYSPMFFSVGHNGVLEWAGYDIALQEWTTLPSLGFLPRSPDPGLLKEFLVAGGDGLLCINIAKPSEAAPMLVVCNPLTQETRELPPMNFPRHPVLMHLLVDRYKNTYKVIVAGSSTTATEHLCRKTEVYCSESRSWVVTGDLPAPDFGLNEYQNGGFCDGMLYCVALAAAADYDDDTIATAAAGGGKVVLAYHVAKGEWLANWHCSIPSFRCQAYFATTQIVGFGGSIFVFSEQEYIKDVKFCIARLDSIEIQGTCGAATKQRYYMKPNWSPLVNLEQQAAVLRGNNSGPGVNLGSELSTKQEFIKNTSNSWSSLMDKVNTDLELWEWVQKEPKKGDWTKLLQQPRQGSRGLLVYPENMCVAQESENKLCIFNTVVRTMVIHDFAKNSYPHQTQTQLRHSKKKFHSLNPLGFTFKPNFNASV